MSVAAEQVKGRPLRAGLIVAVAGLVIDQASKLWVLAEPTISAGERLVLTPFMDFVLVWNRGISYGLFQQDADLGRWLLIGLSIAAVAFLGRWLTRTDTMTTALALGLILGGAVGNTIDRIAYGAVVDFVHLHAFGYSWYVFNAADAWIVAGVLALLYDSFANSGSGSDPADRA
ncbi:signal peptidase II [Methylobrevis albus]|uniref:Lipoprotein signal peptidase n=1 Tax=Methylobrevis albus TaxID=2793297 RepID=A0A931I2P5_9HYPH|nr:signal peptidase II [Methylobrevis albus]MBH0238190.1 signal peptidase II [Methylobrevis albus]